MDHLVDQGVKMLVIACNSASAAMLRDARERYDVPVVEVIQPAVRRAVAATRNGRVGVIGTRATIATPGLRGRLRRGPAPATCHAGPARGSSSSSRRASPAAPELLAVAHEYLDPLRAAGVDTLVLGCTHYPLLTGVISYVMGEEVTLVSSAEETAKDVYRTLVGARPAARPAGAAGAAAPVPRHRRPGAVRAARPALPRPGGRPPSSTPGSSA